MARMLTVIAAAASVAMALPSARQADTDYYEQPIDAELAAAVTCDQATANAGYHDAYRYADNDVCNDFMCGNDHADTACKQGESYVKICDDDVTCKDMIQGSSITSAQHDITVTFGSKGCVEDIVLGPSVSSEWEITQVIMKGQNGYCKYPTLDAPSLFKVTDPSQVPEDVGKWCTPYVNQNYARADISHISLCIAPKVPEDNECPVCEECDEGPSCGLCKDMHFDITDFSCKCDEDGYAFSEYNPETGVCCGKIPCGENEVEGPGGACFPSASDTAFAGAEGDLNSKCFIPELATRWGWVQTYQPGATTVYTMWAGAAKCDTANKGFIAGTAQFDPNTATVTIMPIPAGYENKFIYMTGAHAHIKASSSATPDASLFPKSLAPGQYNANCKEQLDKSFKCTVDEPAKLGTGQFIHWIAHANVQTPSVHIFN